VAGFFAGVFAGFFFAMARGDANPRAG
jgi:hypothetical protein